MCCLPPSTHSPPGEDVTVARARSAVWSGRLIIGVESVPERQELARTYGADEIVDFTKEDVVGHILDLTDGEGVDTSIKPLITF
jgi:threonine dehydrogenase-like Zn-dependent dehydrogenase